MDISAVTATASAPASTSQAKSEISSDFQTFLKMLTTQMRNQDPLNPLDSTDFAVQLATFSNVEQQVKSNDLLAGLSEQMAMMGVSQLVGWVGMEARTTALAAYSGSPMTLYGSAPSGSQAADLVVRDAQGREVYRGAVAAGADRFTWNGTDSRGNPVGAGDYTFGIEGYQGNASLGTAPLESYARIREVRVENGTSVMLLDNGQRVTIADISGLREPG